MSGAVLEKAAQEGTPETVRLLREYGARLDVAHPLHAAATSWPPMIPTWPRQRATLEEFLEWGVDVNGVPHEEISGLMLAPKRELTALHCAIFSQQLGVAGFLMQHGASLDGTNRILLEMMKKAGMEDLLRNAEIS